MTDPGKPTAELVEALRDAANDRAQMEHETLGAYARPPRQMIEWKAAETIARLEAENAGLREGWNAAVAFIESHVADPDITPEMWRNYERYLAARAALTPEPRP